MIRVAVFVALSVLSALSALPAAAQDVVFSPFSTEFCLANSITQAERQACIGNSSNLCMSETPGGDSTAGMSGCLDAELRYWDSRLNAAYQQLVQTDRADDAEFGGGAVPMKEPALRSMQRAWITFRDTRCAYERAQWGGGSGGGPAALGCLLQLTAEQALYLEAAMEGV